MSFRTLRVIFITPFYMIFQFFLLKYIFLLFGGVNNLDLAKLAIVVGLFHLVPMFFEAKKSTVLGRVVSTIDGVWMWGSMMFFIDIVAIYLIKMFVEIPFPLICILLAIIPILGLYNYYNAHNLVVKERVLELNKLSRDINIVHLSDVHFGSVRHRSVIRQISDKLKQLENDCDLVIISGDLADGSSAVEKDDFLAFKDVKIPIIFTPGNHDFYLEIENVIEACKNAGVIVLDNKRAEFECLNIVGASYSFDDKGMPDVNESLIKPGFVNIINYHVPYFWEEFSSLGFDVQLSGHTHGGQFYPVIFFAELIFKYNMGLFKSDSGKYLHVTTGVGSMDIPMRWGTNSELVILRLKKSR